jgi:putative oxidoreductase
MTLGATAIRGLVGPLFIGHGTQKLFGWFGGDGIESTTDTMEALDMRPPRRRALAAGLAETVGGALLTAGALTPVATTLLSSTMVTAIRKVHAANGPWNAGGGWEYNAVLIAALTAVADHGPGPLSVDAKLFPTLKGPHVAALSLAAAVAGSYLVTARSAVGEPEAEAPQPGSNGSAPAREPVGTAT